MRQLQPFQPFKINRILVGGRDAEGFFFLNQELQVLKKFMSSCPGHLDFLARLASNF